jgi:hypothetical protein
MQKVTWALTSLAGLAIVTGNGVPVLALPNPSPVAQQTNTWKPIARIEQPSFPITVELVNETGVELDYDFTDNSPDTVPQKLPVDGRVKLQWKDAEPNLSISQFAPVTQAVVVPYFKFKLTPKSSNSITIIITGTNEPNLLGDDIGQVIDIQTTGGIFIY